MSGAPTMKELRVEDALLYLDQVKVEFGDRPHIYNEFLDIMKTFKTQQIDTPGVIRRVSNLFQGNRRLVLGFNTFLPEGYKIELPADGEGPPVAVFRAPGSTMVHILNEPGTTSSSSEAGAVGGVPEGGTGGPPQPPSPDAQAPGPSGGSARGPSSALHGRSLPMRSNAAGQPAPNRYDRPVSPPTGGFAHHLEARARAQAPDAVMDSRVAALADLPNAASPQQQQSIQSLSPSGGRAPDKLQPRAGAAAPNQQPPPQGGIEAQAAAQPSAQPAGQPQSQQQAPLEFDHAINYVTTIKKRFANEPETYKKFLEILHTYQKEQRGIKEVLDEVSVLFADHSDLLKQFTYFLPDAVQAQAKMQLDEVAKEAEARKRSQAKDAIMHQAQGMQQQAQQGTRPQDSNPDVVVPFGATQGRYAAEEQAMIRSATHGRVSFDPVRPPKPLEDAKKSAAIQSAQGGALPVKQYRPKTIPEYPVSPLALETAFFYRVKHHLSRKELSPEKVVPAKRHTPYVEFIKCLHLFGAGIVNKEELLLLLRGLFTHGHATKASTLSNPQIASDAADLLRDFEQILVGRGPYAKQEADKLNKSKYGSFRARDMDFEDCLNPTPSYWAYPKDYPASSFLVYPSRHGLESKMLNDELVSLPTKRSRFTDSLETYDGVKKRHNMYEEAMARVEEERYEVDMAIARNAQALVQIEPLAQECLRLRQKEELDGQPIGRLRYDINAANAITSVVINAIARVYGDRGDEVIQHMTKNPLIVLPIVYQRLKQKHDEWRTVREGMRDQWKAITESNYEGCMDTQCYFRRRELEHSFRADPLVDQCKRAKYHKQHTVSSGAISFSIGVPDQRCLLFEPCIIVQSKAGCAHRDAFRLLAQKVKRSPNAEAVDLERIGRIWAEFMVPWYGYPAYWVTDEISQSFSGRLSQSVVKFSLGQKVKTIYGEGTVTLFESGKYRVKLAIGTAFLGPSAVLHAIPSKDAPFVRRDGKMERDTTESTKTEGPHLPPGCQALFATRRIYLFLRLHLMLCCILEDLRKACGGSKAVDPATLYVVPPGPKPETSERLDYSGLMAALKNVTTKTCDHKTFETFGRKISKENVHLMASLPKLVERCAEALISLAKEDALLHLYDYCQYSELNPSIAREHCFSMAPDADFRVQFDGNSTAFSYLPRGVQVPSGPRQEDHIMDEPANREINAKSGEEVEPMETDDDPAEDYDTEPALKRMKLT